MALRLCFCVLFWLKLTITAGAADAPTPLPEDSSTRPPLVITRFWHPWLSTSWPYDYFYLNGPAVDENGVWFTAMKPGQPQCLFRVSLPDFDTRIISMPREHAQNLVATRDALYMICETAKNDPAGLRPHQIVRYDRATSQWAVHELPACLTCKLYAAENSLYLFLDNKPADNDSTIASYHWDQDKVTILSSTRRRPAQNPFDDRPRLLYAEVFAGPGHRPCVTTPDGTFYIREEPGPWPEVFAGSLVNQSITSLGKTLVLDQHGDATVLDPDQTTPEYLMASSEPRFRKPASPGSLTVKELAPWAAQTIWNPPWGGEMWYTQTAVHDDCLFILNKPRVKGGAYDLVCYQKGKGREPQHIPLEFHLDEKSRAILSVKPEHAPATWDFHWIEHPDTTVYPSDFISFHAAKQGLYLQSANVGFWFLPYGDIAAYLNSARN